MTFKTPEERSVYYKQWRQKRIAAGLCTYCGRPNPTSQRFCQDCKRIRESWPSKQPNVVNASAAKFRAKLGEQYAVLEQRYRLNIKLRIVKRFGGKCVGCGERNPLVLTLNHIHGYHGINPKVGTRGGWPLYMRILRGKEASDKYDLRCYNCQILYEFQRGRIFGRIKDDVRKVIEESLN